MFTPSRCCKGWKGMASRRPGNCRASNIYKEGAELVVDARGRRRSSAAPSVEGRGARPQIRADSRRWRCGDEGGSARTRECALGDELSGLLHACKQ